MEHIFEKIMVMILSGGKGERLYPLTKDRAKPSVPFLGAYRIIDFSLSNCLNSGLRKIALLTQYKSLSLERHILFGWNIFHPESRGSIISLPAQGRVGERWYEGTADAVFQNIYSIQQENPEAVLVLSGDHVYKADYGRLIKYFLEKDADAVVLAKPVPRRDGRRFGIVRVDEEQRMREFVEKPKNPPSVPTDPDHSLASMGIYLFKTPNLIRALIQDAKNAKSTHDFGRDVLPRLIREHKVYAYPFDGYWEDIGTIDAFWKSNMAFLSPEPPFELSDAAWPIRTYQRQHPPAFIDKSSLVNSIVSSGCHISGANLRNSILSPGVRIGRQSEILDSIVFDEVQIGKNVRLKKVIVDKNSIIPDDFVIGYDEQRDGRHFKLYGEGIRIVPKNWRLD
ncbi:MAG: glucose-1-phosphate adenylyltransferase [Candidatus Aminicenantes bacterium]|nr:glucose-1-phosphate adenylyltransferase [Candidatus Aminicenantes bacterium]